MAALDIIEAFEGVSIATIGDPSKAEVSAALNSSVTLLRSFGTWCNVLECSRLPSWAS